MRVAAAQASPVWLDPAATTAKVIDLISEAGGRGVELLAFPEAFLCGYPAWVCRTDGASFENPLQKAAYGRYLEAAVTLGGPELRAVADAASRHGVFTLLGVSERGDGPARGTVYCTLAAIDPERGIVGAHRKLVPTHDERLVWGRGDGHGLRTHRVDGMRVGGLSCWENWMPQARHALYADGEDVHVGTWPGWSGQVADLTRMIALEGRVFSVAASGLLSLDDIPDSFPLADRLRENVEELPFDGGSGIVAPDGTWLAGPAIGTEGLVVADIDPAQVAAERLYLDPTGHYARPDVFEVRVDRRRQRASTFDDDA